MPESFLVDVKVSFLIGAVLKVGVGGWGRWAGWLAVATAGRDDRSGHLIPFRVLWSVLRMIDLLGSQECFHL